MVAFTIRVDRARAGHATHHQVYSCSRYTVRRARDESVISLDDENDVRVGPGEVAYVMNVAGNTIDVVRGPQTWQQQQALARQLAVGEGER